MSNAAAHVTGEQVRSIRERLGLTQHELAEFMGVGDKSVSNWESDGASKTAAVLLMLLEKDPSLLTLLDQDEKPRLPGFRPRKYSPDWFRLQWLLVMLTKQTTERERVARMRALSVTQEWLNGACNAELLTVGHRFGGSDTTRYAYEEFEIGQYLWWCMNVLRLANPIPVSSNPSDYPEWDHETHEQFTRGHQPE